jgi:putative MFS transporter
MSAQPSAAVVSPSTPTPWTPYQKRLFFFLSVATFFEGYDFLAITQILPNLRRDMGLTPGEGGALIGFTNIGMVLAFLLVRKADVWGRKPVLSLTIVGYTLASLLTSLMPNAIGFGICQLFARFFLIAEWAVATVYAAEEFPAARRGFVIGLIQASASLGSITCAGVVPLLLKSQLGWRMVFLVGTVPLTIMALVRRSLRETGRFENMQKERQEKGEQPTSSLFRIFRGPAAQTHTVWYLAAAWGLTYVCTFNLHAFFKEYALAERGMNDAQVGGTVTVAAVGSLPLIFFAGRLLDVVGRRVGAIIIFGLTTLATVLTYQLHSRLGITAGLTIGIFGISAVLPVLNAFTTELFPTDLRSDALAWANMLIGRTTQVVSPWILGVLAGHYGWSGPITATAIFPLLALVLILARFPETAGRELEETARLH